MQIILTKRGCIRLTAAMLLSFMSFLKKPPQGIVVPFLLNTDDVEPDRYSMNPLKHSLVESGQSAFPRLT